MLGQCDTVGGTGSLFLRTRGHWEASHRHKCPGFKRLLMQLLFSPAGSPLGTGGSRPLPASL